MKELIAPDRYRNKKVIITGGFGFIGSILARHKKLAHKYAELLGTTSISLPKTVFGNEHVYSLYVCRHPERDQIISGLQTEDIFINIRYQWHLHTMTAFQYLGYKKGVLPYSEKAANKIFSLPVYPSLSDKEHGIVITALCAILADFEKE